MEPQGYQEEMKLCKRCEKMYLLMSLNTQLVLIFYMLIFIYSVLPKYPGKQRNVLGIFYFKIAFLSLWKDACLPGALPTNRFLELPITEWVIGGKVTNQIYGLSSWRIDCKCQTPVFIYQELVSRGMFYLKKDTTKQIEEQGAAKETIKTYRSRSTNIYEHFLGAGKCLLKATSAWSSKNMMKIYMAAVTSSCCKPFSLTWSPFH